MDNCIIAKKCEGEGAGSCKRCRDNGKWNSIWMCFLYKIEGMKGCYCSDCIVAIGHSMSKEIVFKD